MFASDRHAIGYLTCKSVSGWCIGLFLLQPVLRDAASKFPDCSILSYCDNVYVSGPPASAINCKLSSGQGFSMSVICTNFNKTEILLTCGEDESIQQLLTDAGLPRGKSYVDSLGAMICASRQKHKEFGDAMVARTEVSINRIRKLSVCAKFAILRQCLLPCGTYLTRTTCPADVEILQSHLMMQLLLRSTNVLMLHLLSGVTGWH